MVDATGFDFEKTPQHFSDLYIYIYIIKSPYINMKLPVNAWVAIVELVIIILVNS